MTYSVRLINRALRALNEPPIDNIDPEDLDEQPGRVIKLLDDYEGAIGRALKAIGRGSFVAHVTLTPLAIVGEWKFKYRFQLPADGLCFLDPPECLGLEEGIDIVDGIEQKVLRATDDSPIDLSYVRRCNPDLLSEEAFEACGLTLAAACAWQITASRDHAKRVEDKADRAVIIAKGSIGGSTDNTPRRHNRMGAVRGGAQR